MSISATTTAVLSLLPSVIPMIKGLIFKTDKDREQFPTGGDRKEHVMNAISETLKAFNLSDEEVNEYMPAVSILIDITVELLKKKGKLGSIG